ncbi:MAG TPA: hypothetical protein VGF47_11160 [Solirubrobacteraceae bacterium]|jgi:Tol biopolymer transport system component
MLSGVSNSFGVRRALWPLATLGLLALAATFAIGGGARAAVSTAPAAGVQTTIAYVVQSGATPASIWTMRSDGSQKTRLGAGATPLVAPGGQQVAATLLGSSTDETGPALAIYSTTGAAPLTYLNVAHESAMPLAWSPDGRYLAVDVQSTEIKNNAQLSGLAVVDVQTNTIQVLAHGQLYGASFAPNGSDEIVYGLAASQSLTARVNVYSTKVDGSGTVALTNDGRSLFPVWGPGAIAYDRERLRRNDAPVYQVWLRSSSGRTRRLTNIRVRSLVSGLVPIAFSSDGRRLLTQFVGQDTSEAWTVLVPSGRARRLTTTRHRSVQAAAFSSDGRTVLINGGGFFGPASEGRVALVPFTGGHETLLAPHGSQASWNG